MSVAHSRSPPAYPITSFIALATACAMATARRRAHIHASVMDSWLAPLGASRSTLSRMLLAPLAQVCLWLVAIAIALAAGSLSLSGAATLGSVVGLAYGVGQVVGSLSRRPAAGANRDFHYVGVRETADGVGPVAHAGACPLSGGGARAGAGETENHRKGLATCATRHPGRRARRAGLRGHCDAAVCGCCSIWPRCWSPPSARLSRQLLAGAFGYSLQQVHRRVRLSRDPGKLWTWAWVILLAYAVALPGALRLVFLTFAAFNVLLSCAAIALAYLCLAWGARDEFCRIECRAPARGN